MRLCFANMRLPQLALKIHLLSNEEINEEYMKTETSNNAFWVYILQTGKHKEWIISTTLNIEQILNNDFEGNNRNIKLLYCRRFDEMFLALGHKMLLSFLDSKSVRSIVRRNNPLMEDISMKVNVLTTENKLQNQNNKSC